MWSGTWRRRLRAASTAVAGSRLGRFHGRQQVLFRAGDTTSSSHQLNVPVPAPQPPFRLFVDNTAVTKVTVFKYLGVSFVADRALNVDVSYMKRRFYSSCNSILCKSKLATEPVRLQLIKSYCLPYLTYCIGALQLSETKLRQLNVYWNDAFRRVFGLRGIWICQKTAMVLWWNVFSICLLLSSLAKLNGTL